MHITDMWRGYERHGFTFEGKQAYVVLPHQPDASGRWLLKTEYFDAFPEFELAMLERGFHLAYVTNDTRWHTEEDDHRKDRFAAYLVQQYGLAERCLPVGMSCGGMQAVYFAARYPQRVAALYLDAPVLNLLSCPCALGDADEGFFDEFYANIGLTVSQLLNYRNHPIDKVPALLQHHLPVMLVAGDSDTVVPYHENGAHLEQKYREADGDITVIIKPGCGHHPHGLEDLTPIIDFAERTYKE